MLIATDTVYNYDRALDEGVGEQVVRWEEVSEENFSNSSLIWEETCVWYDEAKVMEGFEIRRQNDLITSQVSG